MHMELCAICKKRRQQCPQECVLAPYLPANNWAEKRVFLVKVFGMENVVSILNKVDPSERKACVDSLCFEAEVRIRDPVHGCVGIIHRLQPRIEHLELRVKFAKEEQAMIQRGQKHQHQILRSLL